jgi:polysaccharide deacetylase 2 family uncharacterized protein YibQ
VAPDDLNAPLGQQQRKAPSRIGAPQVLAALLAFCGVIVAGWAAFVSDPLGGEPVVVVSTKPVAAGPAARPAEASRNPAEAHAPIPPPVADGKTITIIDGTNGKRQEVIVPGKPHGRSSLAPDSLLENTRFGAIPKVVTGGKTALSVYARPRALAPSVKDLPKLAVVIGGMGVSASGTADAFGLPANITFAIAPSAADVEKLGDRARADGHEVLLQVPMEPYDYPDNDPGPQTLLTSLPAEQNLDRLHWLMGRLHGYVGIVGAMGARFTASEQAMRPVLTDAARRGLMYLDDGASTRSTARQIAGAQNMPFARADVSIDAAASPQDVDRALARLELAARDNGMAVGIAGALPATVARVAQWAKTVEGRGFVLVPISMVATNAPREQRAASANSEKANRE